MLSALALSMVVVLTVTWLVGRSLSIPGAMPLFVPSVAELWWLVMYVGELLSGTWTLTIAFARLQYLGVVVIPVNLLAHQLGIEQAGGIVTVGTDGEHVSIELTFPRTEDDWDPADG